jgi:NADPH-dependent glutamate synthase beta subunit-like oxidoreductase
MELGEPDALERRRPVPIEGSEFEISCDLVVIAIGTDANPLLTRSTEGLELNRWGYIVADPDTGKTSIEGGVGRRRHSDRLGDGDRSDGRGSEGRKVDPRVPDSETG